jgi:hypothetical protein
VTLVRPAVLETGIFRYAGAVSDRTCRLIIGSIKRRADLTSPGAIGSGAVDEDVRRVSVTPLDTSPSSPEDLWWELGRTIWKYSEDYRKSFAGMPESAMEGLRALHYTMGDGHYTLHHDGAKRIYSAILYLNTVERGGETEFVNHGISVSPVAGTLIFFPAWHPYAHQALPPLSEDKYAVVTWFTRRIAG